jgi:general transcription factor 3C polypeptide 5 (transcription factor C subunit 1)
MREFKFDLSRGWKPNEEILPPPFFTSHPLPFNWGFLQNPSIVEEVDPSTGKTFLKNNQKLWRPKMDYVPYYMETVPQEPGVMPEDPELLQFINELAVVYNERPAWTRRAIGNHFKHSPRIRLLKQALPFIGYGFKGGPFRDAIIKYGLDPRKDKKYRIYQTTYFQIVEKELRAIGTPWRDARFTNKKDVTDDTGHIFDGKSLAVDGKIWQMCDVTDPLLAKLIREAPFRQEFEIENDGWFLNGTVAKIKAIMKTKLVALRTGKQLKDSDFEPALETADDIPDRLSRSITVPVPNMTLSVASIQKLRESGKEIELVSSRYNVKRGRQYNGPLRLKKPLDGKTRPAAKQGPSNGQAPGTKRNPKSKSKTPDGEAGAVGREQSVANSIDPRLLADQEDEGAPDSGIGDDGGTAGVTGEFGGYIDQLEGYGGYDDGIDDETEHSEEDSDRASDSEDSGSEMEEDEDDEDRESDDSDSADSIDFVQYFDPQLAQDEEARPS